MSFILLFFLILRTVIVMLPISFERIFISDVPCYNIWIFNSRLRNPSGMRNASILFGDITNGILYPNPIPFVSRHWTNQPNQLSSSVYFEHLQLLYRHFFISHAPRHLLAWKSPPRVLALACGAYSSSSLSVPMAFRLSTEVPPFNTPLKSLSDANSLDIHFLSWQEMSDTESISHR